MERMKVGFIATVLNEEKTIVQFLDSLRNQTLIPAKVIIVDGGSKDRTLDLIRSHNIHTKTQVQVFQKRGNISTGRNFALRKIDTDIIAISDAGCVLERNWVKNIIEPFQKKNIEIVAGFYKGHFENNFQKNLIPFVLVMPDRVRDDFLPAARSMAIRKKILKDVGYFSEKLPYSEDYEFARRLVNHNKKIFFAKEAIVSWAPRSNLRDTFLMFYRYAYGDVLAGTIRPKVIALFVRYFIIFCLIIWVLTKSVLLSGVLVAAFFIFYSLWAISKNYKYVRNISAVFYLPLFQFISDIAVINGTILGGIKNLWATQEQR